MAQKRSNKNRGARIDASVCQELCLIFRELKDPRIDFCTSVVRTETTRDLKYCKVYVSVLGDEQKKKDVTDALKSAGGFIRRELAQRLNLRITPELMFRIDDSMEYSIHMESLLKTIREQDPSLEEAEADDAEDFEADEETEQE